METQKVESIMKRQLIPFNDEGVVISEDTVLDKCLSTTDQFQGASSADIYPLLVNWAINKNGGEVKPWPAGWISQSIRQLAAALAMLFWICTTAFAQPLKISLAAVKTDLKNNAINVGITYLPALNLNYVGDNTIVYGKKSVFSFTPNIDMQSGNSDAFSSITAKLTGLSVLFGTQVVDGMIMPDVTKVIHTIPVSAGIETNNRFNFINFLVEAGYVPWYQHVVPDWLKHTKAGLFVQIGYKFKIDSTGKNATGGQVDESEEPLRTGILRTKGSVVIDTKALVTIKSVKIGLVGSGDVWLDIYNSATYCKLTGALRVYLNGENYLDMQFQRGSGAPNFNQGDQWGVGLTIAF